MAVAVAMAVPVGAKHHPVNGEDDCVAGDEQQEGDGGGRGQRQGKPIEATHTRKQDRRWIRSHQKVL